NEGLGRSEFQTKETLVSSPSCFGTNSIIFNAWTNRFSIGAKNDRRGLVRNNLGPAIVGFAMSVSETPWLPSITPCTFRSLASTMTSMISTGDSTNFVPVVTSGSVSYGLRLLFLGLLVLTWIPNPLKYSLLSSSSCWVSVILNSFLLIFDLERFF